MNRMKSLQNKMTAFLLSFLLMTSLSGCVYVVAGSIGALGGYVVSPDTVEGISHREQAAIWDATGEILGIMGIVQEKFENEGIIIASVNGAKVTVNVTKVSESTTKLSIKSRKGFLPKIRVSQDVYAKIMGYLSE